MKVEGLVVVRVALFIERKVGSLEKGMTEDFYFFILRKLRLNVFLSKIIE